MGSGAVVSQSVSHLICWLVCNKAVRQRNNTESTTYHIDLFYREQQAWKRKSISYRSRLQDPQLLSGRSGFHGRDAAALGLDHG